MSDTIEKPTAQTEAGEPFANIDPVLPNQAISWLVPFDTVEPLLRDYAPPKRPRRRSLGTDFDTEMQAWESASDEAWESIDDDPTE